MCYCFVNVVGPPLCNKPLWITRRGQTVVGATTWFPVGTEQACLDYCVRTSNCAGVDINLSPLRCWPHTDPADYVDSNIFYQPGTDSYQLLERCLTTALIPTFPSMSTATTRGLPPATTTTTTTTPSTTTRNTIPES